MRTNNQLLANRWFEVIIRPLHLKLVILLIKSLDNLFLTDHLLRGYQQNARGLGVTARDVPMYYEKKIITRYFFFSTIPRDDLWLVEIASPFLPDGTFCTSWSPWVFCPSRDSSDHCGINCEKLVFRTWGAMTRLRHLVTSRREIWFLSNLG